MLEVSGCLRNEKETSVGELERCMIQPSVCSEWEKKWKVWGCQQVSKKYMCLQKKRKEKKRKIINTTKFEVDIVLERKRKKLRWIKVRQDTWV